MKRESFAAGVAMLTAAFGKQLDAPVIELYWMGLNDLSDEEFKQALSRAARECKFMPAPAELRAFARQPRDLAHEAAIAWAAVRKAIDRIDYTARSVDFGPVVNACIRQLGGWDSLCNATVTDLDVWKPKEFYRLYEVFADKPVGDVGRPLEGSMKSAGAHVVPIAGIPSQPAKQLVAADGAPDEDIRQLIGALADDKDVRSLRSAKGGGS